MHHKRRRIRKKRFLGEFAEYGRIFILGFDPRVKDSLNNLDPLMEFVDSKDYTFAGIGADGQYELLFWHNDNYESIDDYQTQEIYAFIVNNVPNLAWVTVGGLVDVNWG